MQRFRIYRFLYANNREAEFACGVNLSDVNSGNVAIRCDALEACMFYRKTRGWIQYFLFYGLTLRHRNKLSIDYESRMLYVHVYVFFMLVPIIV